MPEGDTIFRAARTLNQALAGRVVRRFESVFPRLTRIDTDTPLQGRTIEQVTARGKHLLTRIGAATTLHTHLKMEGAWHLYRPGTAWRRPAHQARIVLRTDEWTAVGFSLGVVEVLDRHAEDSAVGHLGPDLLGPNWDEQEAVRRLLEKPDRPVGEALLDQRNLAGIGNVYKSEVLFACRTNPFVKAGDLGIDALQCLITTARRLLLANVHTSLAPMTMSAYVPTSLTAGVPANRPVAASNEAQDGAFVIENVTELPSGSLAVG